MNTTFNVDLLYLIIGGKEVEIALLQQELKKLREELVKLKSETSTDKDAE